MARCRGLSRSALCGGCFQTGIYRLDKHVSCPWPRVRTELCIVVGCHTGGRHLLHGCTGLNQGFDPITDDDDHVAVLDDLVFVGQVAMAGHDVGAAFALMPVDRPVEDIVQRPYQPLHGSTAFHIDHRELSGRENVARNDDVGAAEVDETVTVRDGIRLMKQLDRVAVVKLAPTIVEIGIRRNRTRRCRSSPGP